MKRGRPKQKQASAVPSPLPEVTKLISFHIILISNQIKFSFLMVFFKNVVCQF